MSYLSHFHYQVLGAEARRKMVFLHGLMGFASNWKPIANHFIEDYQVLLYDQRGHGRSFHPEKGYSTVDYAEDLKKILAELGWDEVTLVGHSMGGRVAVEYASMEPDSVERLVVIDIGPVSNQETMAAVEEKISFVPTPFANRSQARAFFNGSFLETFGDDTVKNFFYANLKADSAGQMVWKFHQPGILQTLRAARTGDQWAQFEGLTVESLLLRGERSQDLPRSLYDQVLQRNSHFQGVEIVDAGHWLHVDQPQHTVAALRQFLL